MRSSVAGLAAGSREVIGALVQREVQRDQHRHSGPIRSIRLCDANGIGASGIDHAVQDSDTDGSFGLLTGQLASMEVGVEPNF
jgi:hypothetical protein